jgi:outer membrane protein assembly factor BamB
MDALTAADPRMIGEFRLRARLGAGGMGQVFLATSLAGRMVAVKVIHPELGRDPEFIRRFRGEVSAAARVSGIYTAPVVAAGVDDMPPWLATAFVPGPSLDDIVSRYGPLPVPALWRLAGGLAEALRAIHATGLVHRDLKPANVLLAADGPRVIDFGIARALTESRMTATGSVIGTPGFMSPEQVEGLECGPPSDVFSLGSVLAFAGGGTAPFNGGPGRSSASVMYRVVHAEPDLAAVPGAVHELIGACLVKDARYRPDLGQLAAHCAAMADYLGLPAAAFWPPEVAQVIESKQAALAAQLQGLQPAPMAPAEAPWPGDGMGPRSRMGPGSGMEPAGMGTSPSRQAVVARPTGPSRAGGWDGAPYPGIARDGHTGSTARPDVNRRRVLIGAGAAGIAITAGVTGWAISSRSPGTQGTGSLNPATGNGTGYQADPGAVPTTGAQASGSGPLAWRFATGGQVFASPGAGNGVVYVGNRDNRLYAVTIATQRQAWSPPMVGWVIAAPVVVGGMVCAASETGDFYAIRATSGAVAWSRNVVPSTARQAFAVDGGTVILASDQALQAFDIATQASGVTYGTGQAYEAVSAAGGVVYALDESGTLHAFRATTGAPLWNSALISDGGLPSTSLVVADGALYAGTTNGTLYCAGITDGHLMWTHSASGGNLESNPVATGGLVYFNDGNGNLVALTAAGGKTAWTRQVSSAANPGGPAVAGGRVYMSAGQSVQALDAKTGDPVWTFKPPGYGVFLSTPVVTGGLVFIGSTDENLYAIKA